MISREQGFVCLLLIFSLQCLAGCSTYNGDQPTKRTPGSVIDDQFIESVGKREIRYEDPRFASAHLNVVSMNGIVLLVGQVESEEIKRIAQERMEAVSKVRSVHNGLTIGKPLSLMARSRDTWLTTKIKTKLVSSDRINSNRVKIVAEDGAIFLMGRITPEKADIAVEIARNTAGVRKVVKVFEYLGN